jgi:purine-binding chemotaxis protein CheW
MAPADEQSKSEAILDELKKRQRTREIVNVEEHRVKVVIVVCGANRYAFYGADIREILPTCNISWVPGLPEYLPGLINVRGDIESIIDIRHFLDEAGCASSNPLIAIAVRGDFRSGIMIDAIDDVVDVPLSAIRPPLATLNGAARDLVIGGIEFGGKTISLLDIGKLATLITL